MRRSEAVWGRTTTVARDLLPIRAARDRGVLTRAAPALDTVLGVPGAGAVGSQPPSLAGRTGSTSMYASFKSSPRQYSSMEKAVCATLNRSLRQRAIGALAGVRKEDMGKYYWWTNDRQHG